MSYPNPRTLRRGKPDSADIPTVMRAEEAQQRYEDALTGQAEDIERIASASADARADWEEHRDRVYLALKNGDQWQNEALARATAKATPSSSGIYGEDLYRAHLVTEAAEKSARDHLRALEAQLSSAQTRVNTLLKVTGLY